MPPLQLAVATRCFRQPLKQAVHSAAACGAAGVQLDVRTELKPAELSETGRRQLLYHLDELGLRVASLHFPARRTFYDQDQLEARVAATRTALELAWQLKCGAVTARVGRIPDDAGSIEYQILADVLNDLARHANRAGAVLAITPTRDSPSSLAGFIEQITEGPLAVNFDPAAFITAGHDPVDAFRTLHEHVAHVTLRDAIREVDGTGVEVALGRGEVEWDELLALFDEADYAGWMTAERTSGDDPAGDVARAIQYVKNVARG